jgi:hypothetical protein
MMWLYHFKAWLDQKWSCSKWMVELISSMPYGVTLPCVVDFHYHVWLFQVDVIKMVTIPLMKRFVVDDEGFDIKVSIIGSFFTWYCFSQTTANLPTFAATCIFLIPEKFLFPSMGDAVYFYVCLFFFGNVQLIFDINQQISKRGSPPVGGGQIFFTCPVRKTLRPLQSTDPGKIKRIRGLAYPHYIVTSCICMWKCTLKTWLFLSFQVRETWSYNLFITWLRFCTIMWWSLLYNEFYLNIFW